MNFFLPFFIGIFIFSFKLIGQECATVPTIEQVAFIRSFKRVATRNLKVAMGIIDIPYQLHVLHKDDGTGGIEKDLILQEIVALNDIYLKANIRFVEKGEINYINDSKHYDFSIPNEDALASSNDVENVINIYCLNTIKGGYYGYTYHPEKARKNRVFISKSGFANLSTFPHEMGHFFGLFHTHGKSVTENRKEPIDRNSDKDNNGIIDCYETGDDLCDTPADPNLGLEEYREYCLDNCETKGKIPSVSGDYYIPQITNLMCYNQHSSCRNQFTPEQHSKISQTARYDRKNLRMTSSNMGTNVNGSVRFFLQNKKPMSLTLDINLYKFDKSYSSENTFTFEIENKSTQNLYVSIINMDITSEVNKVYPYRGDIPYLIPNERINPLNGYITLDKNKGREYVCILVSLQPLRIDDIINNMRRQSGTFTQNIYKVLGSKLLPLDNVKYNGGKIIKFSGNLKPHEILPIMLEMEHL